MDRPNKELSRADFIAELVANGWSEADAEAEWEAIQEGQGES